MKDRTAWSHRHTCFSLKILTKNSSILNPHFHSKYLILCFITYKRAKEVEILGKDHLFQALLLALNLFSIWKTSVFFSFGNASPEIVWIYPKMHFQYQYVFIFSVLFTKLALSYYSVVIVFIRHGAPRCFLQTSCVFECQRCSCEGGRYWQPI